MVGIFVTIGRWRERGNLGSLCGLGAWTWMWDEESWLVGRRRECPTLKFKFATGCVF